MTSMLRDSSTAVLCWRRCSHHRGPKVDFTAGGLTEVTGAQELRAFTEEIAVTHQEIVTGLGGGLG